MAPDKMLIGARALYPYYYSFYVTIYQLRRNRFTEQIYRYELIAQLSTS